MASGFVANVEVFLAVVVCGVALLLGVVSLLSYRRLRNRRALLITIGFLLFALKGAYLVAAAYQSHGEAGWVLAVGALDLLILAFLYLAIRA